jgi:hypothetical protein
MYPCAVRQGGAEVVGRGSGRRAHRPTPPVLIPTPGMQLIARLTEDGFVPIFPSQHPTYYHIGALIPDDFGNAAAMIFLGNGPNAASRTPRRVYGSPRPTARAAPDRFLSRSSHVKAHNLTSTSP